MPDGAEAPMTRFTPGPDTARAYRDALGQFATGVTVVTCRSGGGPLGITANSFTSLSLDPPLVLWAPARASRRYAAFEAAENFAVNVLSTTQHDLCHHFAGGDGFDFEGVDWDDGLQGVPLIRNCLARFECTRHAIHDGGDHAIIVGRVVAVQVIEGEPLLFSKGRYGRFDASF